MILAGLLLKLGAYGLIRFTIPLFPAAAIYFSPFIILLAIISIIYSSLIAMRQSDLKRAIAYSSVAHMNFVVLGLFSFTFPGMIGAIFLMLFMKDIIRVL
jgi:NADH-quinone oxidoreductase subunit M